MAGLGINITAGFQVDTNNNIDVDYIHDTLVNASAFIPTERRYDGKPIFITDGADRGQWHMDSDLINWTRDTDSPGTYVKRVGTTFLDNEDLTIRLDNVGGAPTFSSEFKLESWHDGLLTLDVYSLFRFGQNVFQMGTGLSDGSIDKYLSFEQQFVKFYDSRATTLGIQYNADYSAGFDDRSLIDKGFADGAYLLNGATSTLGFTTTIDGDATYAFNISNTPAFVATASTQATIQTNDGAGNLGKVLTSSSQVQLQVGVSGQGSKQIILTDSLSLGILVVDQPADSGLYYSADYSTNGIANHGDRWISDIGYQKTHLAGQDADAIVTSPTATEDGYVISWNDTNSEYELVAGGGASSGANTQIQLSDGSGGFSTDAALYFQGGGTNAIGIGTTNTSAAGNDSIAIGDFATTTFDKGIAIGYGAKTGGNAGAIAIGAFQGNTTGSNNASFISIGYKGSGYLHNYGTDSIQIGNGNATKAEGIRAMAIGYNAIASGQEATALGDGANATQTGTIAIGNSSYATAQGAIMMGYHSAAQTNSVTDTFELSWDGVRGFKTGKIFGTQVTNNADPDTNLTAAEAGSLAWDTTDTELRVYNGATWAAVGGGGGSSVGAVNEIQTSDGAGGFTSDKVFADNGAVTLGDTGLTGAERILEVEGSSANVQLVARTKMVAQEFVASFEVDNKETTTSSYSASANVQTGFRIVTGSGTNCRINQSGTAKFDYIAAYLNNSSTYGSGGGYFLHLYQGLTEIYSVDRSGNTQMMDLQIGLATQSGHREIAVLSSTADVDLVFNMPDDASEIRFDFNGTPGAKVAQDAFMIPNAGGSQNLLAGYFSIWNDAKKLSFQDGESNDWLYVAADTGDIEIAVGGSTTNLDLNVTSKGSGRFVMNTAVEVSSTTLMIANKAGGNTTETNYFSMWNSAGSLYFHNGASRVGILASDGDLTLGDNTSAAADRTISVGGNSGNGDLGLTPYGNGAVTLPRLGFDLTTGDISSPAEGQMWYNNTTNKFRAYENASAVNVIASLSRSVTIVDPTATDDATLFFTPVAITITDVRSHITGTTNVVFNIGHAATRTGTQLDVFTSDITLTSTSGQSNSSGFNDATIPANSWVWLEVVSVSGTPTMFHGTVIYTED